ncbi:HAD family hydrolase [Deinococcus irradiatisoli]|uniref:HAD family hydrolase n=1 Tax=Deinococcus irradiatisoli TaxID=2202254 RepID=UPI001FEA5F14|nr:HAD family phosphatase [Deinococcus irradiatisoli]
MTDPSVYRQAAAWTAETYGLDPDEVIRVMRRHWHEAFGGWWSLRTLADEEAFWQTYGRGIAASLSLTGAQGEALVAEFPYQAFMKPAPGARRVLTALRDRGLKIGVLSNTLPNIWPTLEAIGVADLVDVALSSCALGIHKPAPDVFRLAARALELACDEVLFLDDKLENVEAAREVGMRAALVTLGASGAQGVSALDEVLELVD